MHENDRYIMFFFFFEWWLKERVLKLRPGSILLIFLKDFVNKKQPGSETFAW